MRPFGPRGYDGFIDPDDPDIANIMADYGDAIKNRHKSGYSSKSSSSFYSGKVGGTGKYYPFFTKKRVGKFWTVSTAATVGIFAILIVISFFLK